MPVFFSRIDLCMFPYSSDYVFILYYYKSSIFPPSFAYGFTPSPRDSLWGFLIQHMLLREFPAKCPLKKSRGFNLALMLIPFFYFRNYTVCRFQLRFSVYKPLGFPSIKLWVLAHYCTSSVLKLIFSPRIHNFSSILLFCI